MYHIYLKDGTELEAHSITLEPHIVMILDDRDALNDVLDHLTKENLGIFEVYTNGNRLTGFTDTELIGVQLVVNSDGSMTAHFYFEGTMADAVDPAYKEAFQVITGAYDA